MAAPTITAYVNRYTQDPLGTLAERIAKTSEISDNFGMEGGATNKSADQYKKLAEGFAKSIVTKYAEKGVAYAIDAALYAYPPLGALNTILKGFGFSLGDKIGPLIAKLFGTKPPSYIKKAKEVGEYLQKIAGEADSVGIRKWMETPNNYAGYMKEVYFRMADNSDHDGARKQFKRTGLPQTWMTFEGAVINYLSNEAMRTRTASGQPNIRTTVLTPRNIGIGLGATAGIVGIIALARRAA